MGYRAEFSEEAWGGFAQMFAAAHGMVSQADGFVDDSESDVLFSVIEGEYSGAPQDVLDSFNADSELAREVLADRSAILEGLASGDGGRAAADAKDHLGNWIASSPSDDVRALRGRLLRGLLVEVMYLGLRAGAADGMFDPAEQETWMHVGVAFGLPEEWLYQLRATASI